MRRMNAAHPKGWWLRDEDLRRGRIHAAGFASDHQKT
jgi:hypothetical protein